MKIVVLLVTFFLKEKVLSLGRCFCFFFCLDTKELPKDRDLRQKLCADLLLFLKVLMRSLR